MTLAIGDRVRVISTEGDALSGVQIGDEGVIEIVGGHDLSNANRGPMLTVRTDDGRVTSQFASRFEEIDSKVTFSVGDKVSILKGGHSFEGQTGTIAEPNDDLGAYDYNVTIDGGPSSPIPFFAKELALGSKAEQTTITHSDVRALIEKGRKRYGWCTIRLDVLDLLSIPRDEPTVNIADLVSVARNVGDLHDVLSQVNELLADKGLVEQMTVNKPGEFGVDDVIQMWDDSAQESYGSRFVVREIDGMLYRGIADDAHPTLRPIMDKSAYVKVD